MTRSSAAVLLGGFLVSVSGAALLAQPPQTPADQQKPKQQSMQHPSQVTLTGCLRQTSDDPNVFALVPSKDTTATTGTTGTTTKESKESNRANFPLYRLDDKGQKLEGHIGHRVEVSGKVTLAKDEKGADIIASRSENIGVPTTTITTVDLRPAPKLEVTTVRAIAGECPPMAGGKALGTTGTAAAATPVTVSVGDVSDNPDRYIGQTVQLTGEVERVFNPRVFSLDEDRVFSTGVDVLVLSKNPGMAKDDQRVTVTGVVRKFVRADFQKEIIDLDMNPEWLIDFESRPVVIATEVTVAK